MKKLGIALSLCVLLAGCGGGGGGGGSATSSSSSTPTSTPTATPTPTPTPAPTPTNVMSMTVDHGPYSNYVDGGFTSVTICTPGTSNCQTINGILVDTGSYGLRLFASKVSVSLTQQTNSGNIGECAFFGSFTAWGPVKIADVKLGGEPAARTPVQIFDSTFASGPPSGCKQTGLPTLSSPSQVGFNGLLGVGVFRQDCGSGCQTSSTNGMYYSCGSSSCNEVAESLSNQVQNPVWLLPTDNNGVLLSLASVGANGALSVTGSLIMGIGTESNNSLGSATVYTTNASGNFTTTYKTSTLSSSFIDSGSNGFFFPDSSITQCPGPTALGFYCPSSTLSLSAINTGINAATGTVNFDIANASQLFSTGNRAFNNIGGPLPGFPGAFDWGLPFFFGRKVFFGIQGQSTPGGTGPYYAY